MAFLNSRRSRPHPDELCSPARIGNTVCIVFILLQRDLYGEMSQAMTLNVLAMYAITIDVDFLHVA